MGVTVNRIRETPPPISSVVIKPAISNADITLHELRHRPGWFGITAVSERDTARAFTLSFAIPLSEMREVVEALTEMMGGR